MAPGQDPCPEAEEGEEGHGQRHSEHYRVLHHLAYERVEFEEGLARLIFCVRWWPAALGKGERFELDVKCRLQASARAAKSESLPWRPVLLWDDAESVGFKWYPPTLPLTASGCQEVDSENRCVASHFERKSGHQTWHLRLIWQDHVRSAVPWGLWAVLQLQAGQHVHCPDSSNRCFEVPLRKEVEASGGCVLADLRDEIAQLHAQLRQAEAEPQPKLKRTLLPRSEGAERQTGVANDPEADAHQAAMLRRIWREELLHRRGRIRVFGRIRGQGADEPEGSLGDEERRRAGVAEGAAAVKLSQNEVALPKLRRSFEFDLVFGPEARTGSIWEEVSPLVDSVFDQADMHACVMAYGQTGAGKTFTMEGSDEQPGLISHTVAHLFQRAADERLALLGEEAGRGQRSAPESAERAAELAELSVSMIEIYQEQLYDLLNVNPCSVEGSKLTLRHDGGESGPEVRGLQVKSPESLEEALALYQSGTKLRRLGVSERNVRSSRSHTVFSLYVRRRRADTETWSVSKISLVDLAGSERQSNSSEYDRARVSEAGSINRSLTSLGKVVQACITRSSSKNPEAEKAHVPYRDSMLTRLLSDSIGGQAKTLLIVHVTPYARDVQESRCTLQFAANAACVQEHAASSRGADERCSLQKTPTPCRLRSSQVLTA